MITALCPQYEHLALILHVHLFMLSSFQTMFSKYLETSLRSFKESDTDVEFPMAQAGLSRHTPAFHTCMFNFSNYLSQSYSNLLH